MKKEKFVNIEIDGEGNVAVIALGEINQSSEDEKCDYIERVARPKLKQALEEHFDAEVEVTSFNVFSTLCPLEVRAMIAIEQDEEVTVQEITLKETWVY